MIKNKDYMIKSLLEKTNKSESECIIINNILENHFIIGHNNKNKIKSDFVKNLNINEEEANELYNICCEIIIKGVFK